MWQQCKNSRTINWRWYFGISSKREKRHFKSEDDDQEDNEPNSSTPVVPKLPEASESTKILRAFFEAKNNLPKNIFKYLAVIEDDIVKRIRDKRNQKLITDFFE